MNTPVLPINRTKVEILFSPDESARFRAFLKDTGRKAGPWVKTIVLKALEAEETGKSPGVKELREAGNFHNPDLLGQ